MYNTYILLLGKRRTKTPAPGQFKKQKQTYKTPCHFPSTAAGTRVSAPRKTSIDSIRREAQRLNRVNRNRGSGRCIGFEQTNECRTG